MKDINFNGYKITMEKGEFIIKTELGAEWRSKDGENWVKTKFEKVTLPTFGSAPNFDSSKKEEVNHPERYGGDTTYECVKVLEAWMSPEEYKGFLKGNAIKYLCRAGKKDEIVQELKKADWYINKLIEKESEEKE